MGINTEWKKILHSEFGYCFLDGLPPNTRIDMVIDDLSLNIRRVLTGTERWSDLFEKFKNRIERKSTHHLKTYVMVVDESEHVPDSKKPTQYERRKANQKRGITPFTKEEIETIKIDDQNELPYPTNKFIERLMLTTPMLPELYSFCCEKIASSLLVNEYQSELIIDGAYTQHITKNNHLGVVDQDWNETTSSNHQAYVILRKRPELDGNGKGKVTPTPTPPPSPSSPVEETTAPTVFSAFCHNLTSNSPPPPNNSSSVSTFIRNSEVNIGEGDLKIPRNISHMNEGNIFIRSKDSDTIPILLLHMRSWIHPLTLRVKYGIFIDPENIKANSSEIIDVVSLWRSILVKFHDQYPGIKCKVETVVMLILLNDSDYTDTFRQVGPVTIWNSFKNGGHKVLYPNSQIRNVSPPPTENNNNNNNHNHNHNNHHEPDQTVIMDALLYGQPQERYSICLTESKIFDFISFTYHNCMLPKKYRTSENNIVSSSMDVVRAKANEQDKSRKESKKYCIPEDDEEIYARIRRVMWTLDYWLNGSKKNHPFLNPTEVSPKSKRSKWGWEKEEEHGNDNDNVTIKRAKRVHRG